MATYYMRADGTAANKGAADGSGGASTFLDVAGHNAETFSAGDVIVLSDGGGDFTDAILTCPSSGSSGNPITYQAASGETPVVSGTDLVTTWAKHTDTVLNNADFVDWTDPTFPNGWVKFGDDVNNYVEESPADKCHLVSDGTWTGITQAGVLAIANTVQYSVKVDTVTSGSFKVRFGGTTDVVFSTPGTHTGSTTVGGGTPENLTTITVARNVACDVVIDEISVYDDNIWKATLTSDPGAVYFDGTLGTEVDESYKVNAENEWHWASNVLYVYSTSDPDTAFTSPGISASSRASCIDTNEKSYITLDGLQCSSAITQGINISTNTSSRPTNIVVQSCEILNQDGIGILIGNTGGSHLTPNSVTIDNVTITDWFRAYPTSPAPGTHTYPAIYQVMGDGSGGDNLTVSNCTISSDLDSGQTDNYRDGIHLLTGDNLVIESNVIDQSEHGIVIKGAGSTNYYAETYTVRYNFIKNTRDDCIWLVETDQTDSVIAYNIMWNASDNGIHCQSSSDSYGKIYNNVIDTTVNSAVLLIFGCENTEFQNNIIRNYGTSGGAEEYAIKLSTGVTELGSNTFDYNCFYKSGNSTPFYEVGAGGARTLAQWQSDMTQEADSLNADPLFVNAGGSNAADYKVIKSSPCVDAGADVSLTTDYFGGTVPAGDSQEIGIYEYQGAGTGAGSNALSIALYGVPGIACGASWTPAELSNLELWLRPEELANPNRLLQTADLTDAAWTETNMTVTGGQTDPDGGSDAALLTPTGGSTFINQDAQGFQPGSDDTWSVWWKRGPGHNGTSKGYIQIYDGVSSTFGTGAVPPVGWERIQLPRTLDGSANRVTCRIWPDYQTSSQTVLVAFPQLEAGTSASAYVENGATAGGLVATWADQSTNGNDATQGTQAAMPLVQAAVLDGYAGALFDGVDDILRQNAAGPYSQPNTVFMVLEKTTGAGGDHRALDAGTSFGSGRNIVHWESTGTVIQGYAGSFIGTDVFSFGSPHLVEVVFNGASSSVVLDDGTPVTGNMGTQAQYGFTVGSGADPVAYWVGLIHEIVFVSAALPAADRTSLLAYFSGRYPTLGI